LTPSYEENPLTQIEHKILSQKTRVLVAAHSEDFVILACTVLIQIKSVTDGRTGRRRDRHLNDAKTREALHAVAHINGSYLANGEKYDRGYY